MNPSWWVPAYIALIAATLLAAGFLAGWLARGDHLEDERLDQLEHTLLVKGRHAQSRPKRLASTGELATMTAESTRNLPVRHLTGDIAPLLYPDMMQ